MTDSTTPVDYYDFLAAAMIPTNEQRIVAALETIVVILQGMRNPAVPMVADDIAPILTKPAREEQLKALGEKTMGRRK